ncbi:MAG: lytic transglycosylase domain-containing protein [Brevinematales bacterium]|nr:lytic transglycosylase domain-containing protein [Brevinematales bacterium]
MKGIKRTFGVFVFVFLFSQMNLPEKVVNKSTYDYVVNLSKFSFVKYDTLNCVQDLDKLISVYKTTYFDTKYTVRRMRDMKGRRVYKRVQIATPRKTPKVSSLQIVERMYNSVSPSSPYKADIGIVYSDILANVGRYNDAIKVLVSISNSSVYDEVLLKLTEILIKMRNIQTAKYYLSLYEEMKKISTSPVYVYCKSVLMSEDGKVIDALNLVRNLTLYDFTHKYEYVNYVVSYFEYVSKFDIINTSSYEIGKLIKEIVFELFDYKFYEEALKVAYLSKIDQSFIGEIILDMKLLKLRGWKKLAKMYLFGKLENVIFNPILYENKIDKLDESLKKLILKSLAIYYIDKNVDKSVEYLNSYYDVSETKNRIFLLASKIIDKLILIKDYEKITKVLDSRSLDIDFRSRDIDRFFFYKGYAYESLGITNKAVEFYERSIFSIPSGYYDFLASRRISELSSDKEIRGYYNMFIYPTVSVPEKVNIAKILFNFDKQNSETYKSYIFHNIKEGNDFLLNIPYSIIDSMDISEKSKIKEVLYRLQDEYVIASRVIRNKLVYKGFSNIFSHIIIMRNRLEMKITRGIYNEGNNITANKFIDAYSKFLPFSIQEVLYPIPYVSDVIYSAERFGVDPNLVYAVMKQESFFQEGAYSRAGAIGLMQVLYSTGKLVARKLDVQISTRMDLFKTDLNIMLGTAYLSMLLDSYGDLNHAISAYNGGPRVFTKTKRKYKLSEDDSIVFSEFLAFRETRNYIKRVVKYYNVYSSIYNFDIVKRQLDIEDKQSLEELKHKIRTLQEQLGMQESSEEFDDTEND